MDPRTTVPELFAIVRQWVPQVQHKIDVIGNEVSWWEGAGPAGTRVTPEPVSLTRLCPPDPEARLPRQRPRRSDRHDAASLQLQGRRPRRG